MLSKYCSNIVDKYDIEMGGVNKLFPNLGNKSKYILHYRNRQQYLLLRMKLVDVHRILEFKQKKHTDFNKDKTKNAVSNLEKYFQKLMNNSAYGKAIENLKEKVKVGLVNHAKNYKKMQANQVLFHKRYLVQILLLFMKFNQC